MTEREDQTVLSSNLAGKGPKLGELQMGIARRKLLPANATGLQPFDDLTCRIRRTPGQPPFSSTICKIMPERLEAAVGDVRVSQ